MKQFKLKLFADYNQFYIQDEKAEGDLSGSWTNEATANLLAVAPGTVGVGTVRNMDVPVVVEIYEVDPGFTSADWDHVNECSIDVPSGKLVVAGCTDYFPDAKRIDLTPGTYSVRILYQNLTKLSEDGLEGDDTYTVMLWPGSPTPARVVKQRLP